MHERFEKKIEAGLKKIAESCQKREQKAGEVERLLRRLFGSNTRAVGLFAASVAQRADGSVDFRWSKQEAWRRWEQIREGCYLLRSHVTDWSPEDVRRASIQLTDAEAAFRVHKPDLQLRPVWHQKRDRVEAHILVCFLSYVLWKTLARMCRQAGVAVEPEGK